LPFISDIMLEAQVCYARVLNKIGWYTGSASPIEILLRRTHRIFGLKKLANDETLRFWKRSAALSRAAATNEHVNALFSNLRTIIDADQIDFNLRVLLLKSRNDLQQ
jgi:hypothetical protein